MDHAGISHNRCKALRGGSGGGVLFSHSAHLESKIGGQKRGMQICPWFHGGYGVFFWHMHVKSQMKMESVPVCKAIYGSQFLTLS
jgi:hypothetical protein